RLRGAANCIIMRSHADRTRGDHRCVGIQRPRAEPHPRAASPSCGDQAAGQRQMGWRKCRAARRPPWSGREAEVCAAGPQRRAGALDGSHLIVDAASGVTGAGRRAAEDYSFAETDGDFRAYKVLRHQHQPEIAQMLGRSLTFTPHLLPTRRGILATCYARLAADRGASDLTGAYAHKYAGAPFVEVLESPDAVTLKGVTGTNKCQVAVAAEGDVVVAI